MSLGCTVQLHRCPSFSTAQPFNGALHQSNSVFYQFAAVNPVDTASCNRTNGRVDRLTIAAVSTVVSASCNRPYRQAVCNFADVTPVGTAIFQEEHKCGTTSMGSDYLHIDLYTGTCSWLSILKSAPGKWFHVRTSTFSASKHAWKSSSLHGWFETCSIRMANVIVYICI